MRDFFTLKGINEIILANIQIRLAPVAPTDIYRRNSHADSGPFFGQLHDDYAAAEGNDGRRGSARLG